jgi:hypothetical protein
MGPLVNWRYATHKQKMVFMRGQVGQRFKHVTLSRCLIVGTHSLLNMRWEDIIAFFLLIFFLLQG